MVQLTRLGRRATGAVLPPDPNQLQIICMCRAGKAPHRRAAGRANLLHQQHLPRALDGAVQTALVMRGQAGVFARQNAALVGHKLPEQVDVFEIERVNGEINLGLRARACGVRHRGPAATAAVGFVGVGFAGHKAYLISRCRVWRRRAGLYFLISSFSVFVFLLRVVV